MIFREVVDRSECLYFPATLLGPDWHSLAMFRKEEEGKTSNHRVSEDMNPLSRGSYVASSVLYATGGGGGMECY